MRIVYMGSPGLAVPPLEHLLLNRYEVVAVYTPPDRPARQMMREASFQDTVFAIREILEALEEGKD